MSGPRLFVYGSLRSDLGGHRPQQSVRAFAFLAANAVLEGPATVSGRLFAPAWHPALVLGPEGQVRGEIWRLNSEDIFGCLDEFEGDSYTREGVSAEHSDGRRVTADTYRYIASLQGVPEIASDDYLDWVRKSS